MKKEQLSAVCLLSLALLHLLGVNVRILTYEYEGRMEALIGVRSAHVLKEIIA